MKYVWIIVLYVDKSMSGSFLMPRSCPQSGYYTFTVFVCKEKQHFGRMCSTLLTKSLEKSDFVKQLAFHNVHTVELLFLFTEP